MTVLIIILSLLILITYLIYPLVTIGLAATARPAEIPEAGEPFRIFVFMAAHNEAMVIRRTLESLAQSKHPRALLHCFIGSDASTDGTNAIIEEFRGRLNLHFTRFAKREGKPAVINQLIDTARREFKITTGDLFLLADANVEMTPEFLGRLSICFHDPKTGLADGVIRDPDAKSGIGGVERQYLQMETRLKRAEGILWGCAMGPFGGAYMIRPELFKAVPGNFLVDDFFIFYNILKMGYRSRVAPDALCFENVSGDWKQEFKRKERISAGNFQNAAYYSGEMMRFWKSYNRVFFLHKFLRWISPLLFIGILVLLAIMAPGNRMAAISLLIMISLLVGLPVLNYLFNQLNLKIRWLQGISYFILMNIALLTGFIKYLKGVRTNVWEPTRRSIKA
jgi:cellulose synthase/poly-beta-1,6-N-acetylglucosamine synthase-like glycosyltransferase